MALILVKPGWANSNIWAEGELRQPILNPREQDRGLAIAAVVQGDLIPCS